MSLLDNLFKGGVGKANELVTNDPDVTVRLGEADPPVAGQTIVADGAGGMEWSAQALPEILEAIAAADPPDTAGQVPTFDGAVISWETPSGGGAGWASPYAVPDVPDADDEEFATSTIPGSIHMYREDTRATVTPLAAVVPVRDSFSHGDGAVKTAGVIDSSKAAWESHTWAPSCLAVQFASLDGGIQTVYKTLATPIVLGGLTGLGYAVTARFLSSPTKCVRDASKQLFGSVVLSIAKDLTGKPDTANQIQVLYLPDLVNANNYVIAVRTIVASAITTVFSVAMPFNHTEQTDVQRLGLAFQARTSGETYGSATTTPSVSGLYGGESLTQTNSAFPSGISGTYPYVTISQYNRSSVGSTGSAEEFWPIFNIDYIRISRQIPGTYNGRLPRIY